MVGAPLLMPQCRARRNLLLRLNAVVSAAQPSANSRQGQLTVPSSTITLAVIRGLQLLLDLGQELLDLPPVALPFAARRIPTFSNSGIGEEHWA